MDVPACGAPQRSVRTKPTSRRTSSDLCKARCVADSCRRLFASLRRRVACCSRRISRAQERDWGGRSHRLTLPSRLAHCTVLKMRRTSVYRPVRGQMGRLSTLFPAQWRRRGGTSYRLRTQPASGRLISQYSGKNVSLGIHTESRRDL